MCEGGLADAGDVFNQQVAAREQAGHSEADLTFLAEDHLADLPDDVVDLFAVHRCNCTCVAEVAVKRGLMVCGDLRPKQRVT